MIHNAFKFRRVLNAVRSLINDLQLLENSEVEWRAAEKLCNFLEATTVDTEYQSAQHYVRISYNVKLFKKLRERCITAIFSGDSTLTPVSEMMHQKLNSYEAKYARTSQTWLVFWIPNLEKIFWKMAIFFADILS